MCVGQLYIADISKALAAQQFLERLRGDAGCGVFFEADRGDFRRRLRREGFGPRAKPTETSGAGKRGIGQELAAALEGHGNLIQEFRIRCRTRVEKRVGVNTCDHVLNAKAKSA